MTGLTMTNDNFSNLFGKPVRNPEKDLLTQFHMDIASSIQEVTEEVILRITKSLSKEYKMQSLSSRRGSFKLCS